jgi:hypothetical protein
VLGHVQTLEPGKGQKSGLYAPLAQLSDTGLDVPAEVDDLKGAEGVRFDWPQKLNGLQMCNIRVFKLVKEESKGTFLGM